MFDLVSKFEPSGDQTKAIEELVKGINEEKNIKYYLVLQEQVKHLPLQM